MAEQGTDLTCERCASPNPCPPGTHAGHPVRKPAMQLLSSNPGGPPNWNRLQEVVHNRRSLPVRAKRRDPKHWRAHITFSVPPLVAEEIRAAAAAQGRTVSNYLVQLFIQERDKDIMKR